MTKLREENEMNEADLRKRPEFDGLPIYDEGDDNSDSLLRCYDVNYDATIHEAEDDVHFWKLMEDPQLEAKGAIRYSTTDVRAVFWRKRSN
jgi:hypothetical protein